MLAAFRQAGAALCAAVSPCAGGRPLPAVMLCSAGPGSRRAGRGRPWLRRFPSPRHRPGPSRLSRPSPQARGPAPPQPAGGARPPPRLLETSAVASRHVASADVTSMRPGGAARPWRSSASTGTLGPGPGLAVGAGSRRPPRGRDSSGGCLARRARWGRAAVPEGVLSGLFQVRRRGGRA